MFRNARITVASAYDAERLARVARLREIVRNPRLLQPEDLRGLSPKADVEMLCKGWPVQTAPDGRGHRATWIRSHKGRQIRIMDGYPPGTRPDPITEGPYAVVSQNGGKHQDPTAEGNPVL